jgi:hypothetical protein
MNFKSNSTGFHFNRLPKDCSGFGFYNGSLCHSLACLLVSARNVRSWLDNPPEAVFSISNNQTVMKPPKLSRRSFLGNSALCAAATSLTGSRLAAQSAKATHSLRLGGVELAIATICTDGFGNHHHEPAFRLIPGMGYRNVEFNLWYADLITPSYIRSIRQRCYETGLTPISLQGSSFGAEGGSGVIKDLSHKMVLLDGCKDLGCRVVKCTGSRRDTNGGIKAVIEVCKELAPVAEAMDMLVVLENHANNVLENIGDYEEIFSAIDSPNIGMCADLAACRTYS